MNTLRYGIAAITLVPLLVSPGLTRFYDRLGRPMPVALVALLIYLSLYLLAWLVGEFVGYWLGSGLARR